MRLEPRFIIEKFDLERLAVRQQQVRALALAAGREKKAVRLAQQRAILARTIRHRRQIGRPEDLGGACRDRVRARRVPRRRAALSPPSSRILEIGGGARIDAIHHIVVGPFEIEGKPIACRIRGFFNLSRRMLKNQPWVPEIFLSGDRLAFHASVSTAGKS